MKQNLLDRTPKVGVVSFTDPRSTSFADERESYIREKHAELVGSIAAAGFDIVDPMSKLRGAGSGIFGLASIGDVKQAADIITTSRADCIVLGLWHWTEPELPLRLAKLCGLPTALYTADDPRWAGTVCLSAVGASMWEIDKPEFTRHLRVRGDMSELVPWVRAQTAVNRLAAGTLLMWGGSYALRMEHLCDDHASLKSYFVGDILTEDQFMLVKRAEDILAHRHDRIDAFASWASKEGIKVEFDDRMFTQKVYDRQIALHLAAVDRLAELREEDIIGVSIKCQPELSVEYGVTACMLPGFLPFGRGPEGARHAVATVCEGDTKGLVTSAMLHALNPGMPPLFGDLKYFNDDMLILSNCGGSSVAWALCDGDGGSLCGVSIKPQCQGESGGAVGYDGKPGKVTVARLVRVAGEYVMQLGLGEAIAIDEKIRSKILWGHMWPHIAISFGEWFEADIFAKVVGSNHLSATSGDFTSEMEYLCRRLDIPIVRIDDAEDMMGFADAM